MSSVTFDTLKFVERLEKAGVPREQAAAIAEAQQDAFSQALALTLVTKADIARLETSTKDGMAAVKLDLAHMDAKVDKLSWMMGILIALAVANFAKQFF